MKNSKRLKLFSCVLALAILVGYLSVFVGVQTVNADTGYYSGITATGGQALLGQLHDLITTTHKKYTSYDDCKTPSIIKKTDPGTNGNVREFYTQDDISSTWGSGSIGTWNREHVWCQSLSNGLWGTSGGGSAEYPPSGMQFNVSKDSYYLASNVALPGSIKSVTVKMVNGKTERPWKLLTSDTPYGEVAGKPSNGNDHGIKTVTSESVTWEVDGDDVYFALTYEYNETTGASYIESIIIEYGKGGSSGDTVNADSFVSAVGNISSAKATEAKFNAIKSAITEYKTLTEEQKQLSEVKTAYATLQVAIEEYNAFASEVNGASQSAIDIAAGAAIAFSSLAAAILAVIRYLF